ncbi:MAG: hypothetical protein R2834_10270 [Rhodothermales bacterium]
MTLQISARGTIRVLSTVALLLTLAHGVSAYWWHMDENRFSELLVEKFSFEGEGNFPSFFSGALLLLAAGLFGLIARSARAGGRPGWGYWSGLSALFFFLTFDEAAQLHEKLDTDLIWASIETTGFLAWPWVIIYGGLTLAFIVVYGAFWYRLPPFYRLRYGIAGALYVCAALGFEMVEANLYVTQGGVTPLYIVVASLEEVLEMVAIIATIGLNMRYLSEEVPARFVFTARDAMPA